MKYLRLIVVGMLLALSIYAFTQPKTCNTTYRHDATVHVGNNSISAETAKTETQREKGLGGRACIGADQSMLFVFNKPDTYPFWMKDMKFAIDIVWVNSNHKVVTIKSNVSPSTYPATFENSTSAQYVLELKAGQANNLGIKQGTTVNF